MLNYDSLILNKGRHIFSLSPLPEWLGSPLDLCHWWWCKTV